ncbi:cell division protein ZapA [bacterium]|nr:MAG: cell division protein ZapA [bacterium]
MKICEVDIYGDIYSLRVDMDENFVRELARMVDSRMKEVSNASPSASPLQVAVLAALDLASESLAAAREPAQAPRNDEGLIELADEVSKRADAMLEKLKGLDNQIHNA